MLVDASDDAHPVPGRLAQKLAEKDSRVVYRKVGNGGIAANTTAGFALASGDYLALLDHDDLLYPNSLFECVQTIQTTGADLVYSDEIVLSADLKQLGGYHFKPDFAPDYLRGCNFITHLAVFSRPLLDAAGAAEYKEFDGAQDHDLLLRLTETVSYTHLKVMAKTGLTVADMDLIEANEAFAAQSLAVAHDLEFDMDKVNVNGGAIALGHPVGASGARILVTLLYAMKHRGAHKGLATLCIGGGMGCATIVEM